MVVIVGERRRDRLEDEVVMPARVGRSGGCGLGMRLVRLGVLLWVIVVVLVVSVSWMEDDGRPVVGGIASVELELGGRGWRL